MASYQDQIDELRVLIRENRFDEAREILETLNHPKAHEWLKKLDEREAAYKASSAQNKPSVRTTAAPKPQTSQSKAQPTGTANTTVTFARVLIGSIIGFGIVLTVMVLADRQFAIHDYFLDDSNRRVMTLAVGFTLLSTTIFSFIARFIGDASHFVIGLYYGILSVLLLGAWHYLSVYYMQGGTGGWFSADAMTTYRLFLNEIPFFTLLAYGASLLSSVATAYFLGATSDEELQKRTERMKANRR